MLFSSARLATTEGSKYLQQLCKHFGHKVPVSFDEKKGRCELPSGLAELTADPQGLTVNLTCEDAKALISARFVVDSHLVTFAFREGFTGLNWRLDEAAA